MKTMKDETHILVDTDVLIHLNLAERMSLLQELFPKRVFFLDVIIEELRSLTGGQIDMMIQVGIVQEMTFPTNIEIVGEYARLKKTKGKGESGCLAVCRYQKKILASSNLADTKDYCKLHGIRYLTTMDILAIGYLKGFITLDECDECIQKVLANKNKLPYKSIQKYIDKDFDKNKLNYC